MVSILLEPNYASSLWCRSIYKGLVESLRQKRIPYCEIFDHYPADSEGVFIIASDYAWIKSALEQFNRAGIQPILLSNQLERIPGYLYSCVASDVNASIKNLMTSLGEAGKLRLAFYGVNENSLSDMGRVNAALTFRHDLGGRVDIFYNHGSLAECYSAFSPRRSEYDGVICPNDVAARSLVNHLEEEDPSLLASISILSCAKTALSQDCPYIQSIDLNLELFGVEAVRIFEQTKKHPHLSSITSCILWEFPARQTPAANPAFPLALPPGEEAFYDDRELSELLILDRFFTHADPTDRQLFRSLVRGESYDTIAEHCFLTESGIKYRVKRLLGASKAESREELLTLLRKYRVFSESI